MVNHSKVQALAEVIYAEKYEHRVRAEVARGNPGAWVACFHLRRRAYDDAREVLARNALRVERTPPS